MYLYQGQVWMDFLPRFQRKFLATKARERTRKFLAMKTHKNFFATKEHEITRKRMRIFATDIYERV